jgi:hypothetical protein
MAAQAAGIHRGRTSRENLLTAPPESIRQTYGGFTQSKLHNLDAFVKKKRRQWPNQSGPIGSVCTLWARNCPPKAPISATIHTEKPAFFCHCQAFTRHTLGRMKAEAI